jgi:hypothetical protein
MIKMLVAHILLNYDIKLVGAKPKTAWIGTVIIPPRKARVMVRRRGNEYLCKSTTYSEGLFKAHVEMKRNFSVAVEFL